MVRGVFEGASDKNASLASIGAKIVTSVFDDVESTKPVGGSIQNAFPKLNPIVSGLIGTLVELVSFNPTRPLSELRTLGKIAKNASFEGALEVMKKSPKWAESVKKYAENMSTTLEVAEKSAEKFMMNMIENAPHGLMKSIEINARDAFMNLASNKKGTLLIPYMSESGIKQFNEMLASGKYTKDELTQIAKDLVMENSFTPLSLTVKPKKGEPWTKYPENEASKWLEDVTELSNMANVEISSGRGYAGRFENVVKNPILIDALKNLGPRGHEFADTLNNVHIDLKQPQSVRGFGKGEGEGATSMNPQLGGKGARITSYSSTKEGHIKILSHEIQHIVDIMLGREFGTGAEMIKRTLERNSKRYQKLYSEMERLKSKRSRMANSPYSEAQKEEIINDIDEDLLKISKKREKLAEFMFFTSERSKLQPGLSSAWDVYASNLGEIRARLSSGLMGASPEEFASKLKTFIDSQARSHVSEFKNAWRHKDLKKTFGKSIVGKDISELDINNIVDDLNEVIQGHTGTKYEHVVEEARTLKGLIRKGDREALDAAQEFLSSNPMLVKERVLNNVADVSEEVNKISGKIPQSRGAGNIPNPVSTSRVEQSVEASDIDWIQAQNPDKFSTQKGNPIVMNADYGPTFTPDPSCEKGKILRDKTIELGKVLEDAGLSAEVKTAARRKLFESGLKQGLETPCIVCYEYEKQLTGFNAKPMTYGSKQYVRGQIDQSIPFLKEHGNILRGYGVGDFKAADINSLLALGQDLAKHGSGYGQYTKNLNLLEIAGDVGFKYNISVGSTRDIGLPIEIADKYRKRYPNAGTVHVAINDSDLNIAGEDPRVDHLIPTHLGGGTPEWFLKNATGLEIKNFQRGQSESVGGKVLHSSTLSGMKNIEEARKLVWSSKNEANVKKYLQAIEKASKLIGKTIEPMFKQYRYAPWYHKLIGNGPAEYGQSPSLPKIDMSRFNFKKAKEYMLQPDINYSDLKTRYGEIANKIINAAKRGGVKAVNALDARYLALLVGVGAASAKDE
jgi:hypothetical protein